MSAYESRGQFGVVNFKIVELKVTQVQGSLKSNVGKDFIEKNIPSRNKNDIQLTIRGIITGLSRAFGETEQTAIDRDRVALIALDDGYKHAYADGKHSFDGVIVKGSLIWDDDSIKDVNNNANQFSVTIKEW